MPKSSSRKKVAPKWVLALRDLERAKTAVRRIAYEAADAGLLSPELVAGIRRVNGVRRIGVRMGNWLTPEQVRRLVSPPTRRTPCELRDHAMLALLTGCRLRRGELVGLQVASLQQRDDHWVIADRLGKADLFILDAPPGHRWALETSPGEEVSPFWPLTAGPWSS